MEIHLKADAQIKAPPPCIVDDHIRDRVSRLKRQFKVADTLVHPGDIVIQAGVLALTGQHLDIGHVPPHFMFQLTDAGIELLRLMDTRPDCLRLLAFYEIVGLFLPQRRHALLKGDGQVGPIVEQQGQHRNHRQKCRVTLIELEQSAVLI